MDMEPQAWKDCSLVTIDPEVMHGEPVFGGTRVPVQDIVDSYYGYREDGWSDQAAVEILLKSFPTIPGADALRSALAFEAKHEHQLQP